MYEIGRVYIWRPITDRRWKHLSGQETTVTGPPVLFEKGAIKAWPTETPDPDNPARPLYALVGDLRPRDTPSGERMVLELFRQGVVIGAVRVAWDAT